MVILVHTEIFQEKRYLMELQTNTSEFNLFEKRHEVVLQTLEDDDIKAIESGLSTIKGKPIPYSLSHPIGGFKNKTLEEVLAANTDKKIDIVGFVDDAWIDYTGRPTLRAKINVTDPEIEQKILSGDVLISDAYWHDPSTSHISSFEFDHLLIYPRSSKIPQGEPAALILNQGEVSLMTDSKNEKTEPTSLEYANSLLKQNQAELVEKEKAILELNQKIEAKDKEIAQREDLIKQRDELITNQAAEIEGYKKQLEDIEKAEELKVNQDLFKTFPPGIQKKFESRFEELSDDKKAKRLLLEMNQEWQKVPPFEETKAEGSQIVTNQDNEVDDYKKLNAEFMAATGVI